MPDHVTERPVSGQERILALDVLRGFAMVGVLIAYCMWSLGTAPEESWSPLDRRIGDAVGFLIDGKFYTILATLFGLGFSIQLGRASDDATAVETYCRRLVILAGIGLAHALLLRNGDILLPYALTGFLLIPFRRASDRMLILSALAILIANAALRAFWTDLGFASLQRPDLRNASYLTENVAWVRYWYSTALFTWPTNLTMFLLGYCAGRAKLLQRLSRPEGPSNGRTVWASLLVIRSGYWSLTASGSRTMSRLMATCFGNSLNNSWLSLRNMGRLSR